MKVPRAAGHVLRKGHAPFQQGPVLPPGQVWCVIPAQQTEGARRDAGLSRARGACQLPVFLCCGTGQRETSLFLEKACSDLGAVVGEHELRVRASYSHPIPMQVKSRR